MREQILIRKYQQAMQQVHQLTDAVFERNAALEIAEARIAELEKEKEDGKQRSGSEVGVIDPTDQHNEPGQHDEAEVAEQVC